MTPSQVAAVRAYMTMGTYEREGTQGPGGAMLEDQLRDAVMNATDLLEPGLAVIDPVSRIVPGADENEILAEDPAGSSVVIKLCAGDADEHTITDVMARMGALRRERPGRVVRGIAVAASFADRALLMAASVPDLKLKRYCVAFAFEDCQRP